MAEEPKRKIALIPRVDPETGELDPTYEILEGLVGKDHPHLEDAEIALAWRRGWKADSDGRLRLGQARKASQLDRELHVYDFVLLLNYEAWSAADFTADQQAALLDHELCHCGVRYKADGSQATDEAGRLLWRIRKHDIEEFHDVVERHGRWTDSIKRFAKAAMQRRAAPLTGRAVSGRARTGGELANDPEFLKAAEALAPDGKGVTEITLSTPGANGKPDSVTLTPETREKIKRRRKALTKKTA